MRDIDVSDLKVVKEGAIELTGLATAILDDQKDCLTELHLSGPDYRSQIDDFIREQSGDMGPLVTVNACEVVSVEVDPIRTAIEAQLSELPLLGNIDLTRLGIGWRSGKLDHETLAEASSIIRENVGSFADLYHMQYTKALATTGCSTMAELYAHIGCDMGQMQTMLEKIISDDIETDESETDYEAMAGQYAGLIRREFGFDVPLVDMEQFPPTSIAVQVPVDTEYKTDGDIELSAFILVGGDATTRSIARSYIQTYIFLILSEKGRMDLVYQRSDIAELVADFADPEGSKIKRQRTAQLLLAQLLFNREIDELIRQDIGEDVIRDRIAQRLSEHEEPMKVLYPYGPVSVGRYFMELNQPEVAQGNLRDYLDAIISLQQ